MNKWKGAKICEVFRGADGELKRHHGVISRIIYHDIHAQYMYRGHCNDDDKADYWRHELQMILCKCAHLDSDDDS